MKATQLSSPCLTVCQSDLCIFLCSACIGTDQEKYWKNILTYEAHRPGIPSSRKGIIQNKCVMDISRKMQHQNIVYITLYLVCRVSVSQDRRRILQPLVCSFSQWKWHMVITYGLIDHDNYGHHNIIKILVIYIYISDV